MLMLGKKQTGFTIVELLIVVVVIAILATISVVAYKGIQQRATNAAINEAASSTLRVVEAYIAVNGKYPMSGGSVCVTTESGCIGESSSVINGSSTFDAAMRTLSTLPRNVPPAGTDRLGIYFVYNPGITFEGEDHSQPMLMVYYLSGTNQQCGLSNVSVYTWPHLYLSTTGFSSNTNGATRCWISVPGPSA